MNDQIWGVKTAAEGVWWFASFVKGGRVTGTDSNIQFAQRMTKAEATKLAEDMERETGAAWYVWAVARRAA